MPEHPPPLQLVKVDPPVGVAVRLTELPLVKLAVQLDVQLLIPAGLLLTVPVPVPALVTVNEAVGAESNVALTEVFALKVTLQVPVPLHAPPHPVNVAPLVGAAVKVTAVPDP